MNDLWTLVRVESGTLVTFSLLVVQGITHELLVQIRHRGSCSIAKHHQNNVRGQRQHEKDSNRVRTPRNQKENNLANIERIERMAEW